MSNALGFETRESISHWGMIDIPAKQYGTLTINCDYNGSPTGHYFESMEEVMPLMVVIYEGRGMLAIMGDQDTNLITGRNWFPAKEGATPPEDEFTRGRNVSREPTSDTKH